MLGGEIPRFISEIIQNESLEIEGKTVTLERYGKIVSDLLSWGFNVNYPVVIVAKIVRIQVRNLILQ